MVELRRPMPGSPSCVINPQSPFAHPASYAPEHTQTTTRVVSALGGRPRWLSAHKGQDDGDTLVDGAQSDSLGRRD